MKKIVLLYVLVAFGSIIITSCDSGTIEENHDSEITEESIVPEPDFTLTADQTHNKFSRTITPAITVPSGSVIEVYTQDRHSREDGFRGDLRQGRIPHVVFSTQRRKGPQRSAENEEEGGRGWMTFRIDRIPQADRAVV